MKGHPGTPLLFSLVLMLGAAACAQVASTPEPRTTERQAILDAARAPVEAALEQPVIFRVTTLRSDGRWSFLTATPLSEDHERIDYSRTRFADEVRDGVFEDQVYALLHKEPGQGWAVTELAIGAADAPFVDWPQRYGAPKGLIVPHTQEAEQHGRLSVMGSDPRNTPITLVYISPEAFEAAAVA